MVSWSMKRDGMNKSNSAEATISLEEHGFLMLGRVLNLGAVIGPADC